MEQCLVIDRSAVVGTHKIIKYRGSDKKISSKVKFQNIAYSQAQIQLPYLVCFLINHPATLQDNPQGNLKKKNEFKRGDSIIRQIIN